MMNEDTVEIGNQPTISSYGSRPISNGVEARPIEEPVLTEVARPTTITPRFLGAAVLALIFLAGAGITLAYLSSAPSPQEVSQTAATAVVIDPFNDIVLDAQSAYVFDLVTHHVLYALNPDAQLPLASLTKVPLVLAGAEVLMPDTVVAVPSHTPPDGGIQRIPDGSRWHASDLIDFTLISSSNEGAEILATAAEKALRAKYSETPAGSAALSRMNEIAGELGLSHTYFLNPSGLDISAPQGGAYGSARDVATLFAHAASMPYIFEGTTKSELVLHSLEGDRATARNTDKVLAAIPGLIMGKTGYTDLAGGNLAIVFDIGPAHPVVAVVLHSTETGRFDDMKKLITATQAAIALTQ